MNDDLTTRLSRQLHEQVDDWPTTPLTLDGVRGRARSIRRTRRIAAGAAVAAVVAIAAPVAVLAGGRLDAGPDQEVPPASQTPTEAVEQEPSPLGVPYLEGRTLTLPDGSATELPGAYDGVAVAGERVLAVSVDPNDGSPRLDRVDDGEVTSSEDLASFALAPNAEDSAVAYVRADGQLVVESEDGQVELGDHGQGEPVALLGGPSCAAAGDCVVFLDTGRQPVVVDGSGAETPLPGNPLAVEDASAAVGRVAMLTSIEELEPGSCSRVVANDAAEGTVFETCDFTPDRFSPDGSYLSAGPAYRDGIGDPLVAILDGESGAELARLEPANGFVNTFVWEDTEHLLALTHDSGAGEWSVVRLGADGRTETVLGPVPGGEMKPPWRLVGPS